MRVAVVGATGLIGRPLVAALRDRGDPVVAVSRRGRPVEGAAQAVAWMPGEAPFPKAARAGVDAVVNLAGSPLRTIRWTEAMKREIRASRAGTTRHVVEGLGDGGPRVLINASGSNYYGARGDEVLRESDPPGDDFMASTCVLWEEAARGGEARGARVVRLRTGPVLMREGGALARLALPVRLFVGGPLGGGRQWFPWIHVADQVGLILHALDRDDLWGAVNAASPGVVRQRELTATIARVLRRPAVMPAPAFAIRLLMGPEASTLALEGQRMAPEAARESGYAFRFPELEPALRDLLG